MGEGGKARRPLKLGILTTLAGPAADGAGPGSVLAARMAIEEQPLKVELLTADMGERPDTAATTAREWLDRDGVQVILDVPNSAAALAVATLVRDRNRAALFSGPGTTALTREAASPNHLQWTYDTDALARGSARAILEEGGRTWFFLTADTVFGRALQASCTATIEAAGGQVLGADAVPPEATDMASPLLRARSSGAQVVALAASGAQFQTMVKQAAEFRIQPGQRLASPLCLSTNVRAIGLDDAQGLLVTEPFYWDLTPATRAFTARFAPRNRGIVPTMVHAGVYSATRHLLRTLATGADPLDGAALLATMRATPAEDDLFGRSTIRPDGGITRPMHLFRVKRPGQSAGPWDLYEHLRTA